MSPLLIALLANVPAAALPHHATAPSRACANAPTTAMPAPAWFRSVCSAGTVAPLRMHAPADVGDIGYQAYFSGNESHLERFTLPTANVATYIGSLDHIVFGLNHEPDTGELWAVTVYPMQLGRVDTTSGAFTAVAPLSGIGANEVPTGIASVSGRSTLHLSTYHPDTGSYLYRLSRDTGAASLVGPMPGVVIDIAINAEGELYGHDIDSDSIYSIDPATAQVLLVGPTGYDANYAQGMDFDKSTGILYAWLFLSDGGSLFATIDLQTGAATPVAQTVDEQEGALTSPLPDLIFANGFD